MKTGQTCARVGLQEGQGFVGDWRPFFPLAQPRPEQGRALDWICEQLETGHRRLVCELGTGVGKSAVAVTVARWLEDRERNVGDFAPGATVLTSQLILQNQYVKDFVDARDLRAAANFSCSGPVAGTCGETSRVRKAMGPEPALVNKLRCNACPYRVAKDDFIGSQLGITNYSFFLSEGTYAGEIPPRRLLVLDEAHNVEDEVRRWTSVEVSEGDAESLKLDLPQGDGPEAVAWLTDQYKPAIQERLAKLGTKLKGIVRKGALGGDNVKKLANDNDSADKRLCQINRLVSKGGQLLVSHHDNPGKHTRTIRFQPLDVRGLVDETLYSRASAVLLMSATLLDRKIFCSSVGLEDAPYMSVPTTFKAEAFGVRFRPVGRMTRDHIERTLRDYPRALTKVLADNPGLKGIVHTTNYRITRAFRDAFPSHPRLLIQDSARDRDAILKRHLSSSEPTVIVSPSMMEGLDLRDDLGRFQVMCKVPYPDMSDPLVGRKDRSWYDWRTVRTLVQAMGRSVRSESDYTRTYIFDLSLMDLMERCGDMIPKHLRISAEHVEDFV